MIAGRKLDALIAEKVMGWKLDPKYGWDSPSKDWTGTPNEVPRYSTDISAAWEVVEKLFSINPKWQIELKNWLQGYSVQFTNENKLAVFIQSDTAPLAICLAALKTVEIDPYKL